MGEGNEKERIEWCSQKDGDALNCTVNLTKVKKLVYSSRKQIWLLNFWNGSRSGSTSTPHPRTNPFFSSSFLRFALHPRSIIHLLYAFYFIVFEKTIDRKIICFESTHDSFRDEALIRLRNVKEGTQSSRLSKLSSKLSTSRWKTWTGMKLSDVPVKVKVFQVTNR